MKFLRRFFDYIRPLWEGVDGKPSIRAVLAIAFAVDFIRNMSHAVYKWEIGRSFEGLAVPLGIEGGLIVSLLGITAWSNITAKRIETDATNPTPPSPTINVEKANTVKTESNT